MSDIIKIHNLPGLSQYGKSLTAYSNQIKVAAKETERQFITKTNESVSDAILAFFAKLNQLQIQVFHKAPELIEKYGKTVGDFEETVSSLGFDVKAWTWSEGKDTVVNKLNGEQVEEIKGVMDKLQPLLDLTSEKTSFQKVDLINRHLKTAQATLNSLSENRTATHTGIQEAHDSFNTAVIEIINELDELISSIVHAKAIFEIPPATIFTGIQSGLLTKETMVYLDEIKHETDALALKSVLERRPEELVKLDTNKISSNTYESIGGILEVYIHQEDATTLNKLLDALGEKDRDYVLGFTNKLLEAEDRRATSLEALMYASAVKHPERIKNGELKSQENQLNLMNRLIGLMNSTQELKIGKDSEKHYTTTNKDHFFIEYKKNKMSISFEGGQEKLRLESYIFMYTDTANVLRPDEENKRYGKPIEIKNHFSHLENGLTGVNAADYDVKLQKFQKERVEARVKFASEILNSFLDTGTALLGPQVYLLNKAIQYGLSLDFVQSGQNISEFSFERYDKLHPNSIFNNSNKEWDKNTRTGFLKTFDMVKSYFEKEKKLAEINTKEQKAALVQYYDILNKGEWELLLEKPNVDGGYIVTRDRNKYHDINALLRENELNQSGIMGFMDSRNNELKKGEPIERRIDKLTVSPEMKAYLKGVEYDGKKLKLENMSSHQLLEFTTSLKQLGFSGVSDMNGYFDKKYELQ